MMRWLPWLILHSLAAGARRFRRPVEHLVVTIADHFEPFWRGATPELARRRVEHWTRTLPGLAAQHRDDDGFPPRHTFFYPVEEPAEDHLELLGELLEAGLAEVELHLHHRGDDAESLRRKLIEGRDLLARHGFLAREADHPLPRYAFVHGNWALADSRPDGDWCGVAGELRVLRETGCYADFTFPSAPDVTQPRVINRLYYPPDDARGPGALDRGIPARRGARPADRLLLITGPLALNWRSRKWGVLPRIENGALRRSQPPTPHRVRSWIRCNIRVQDGPDWVFVKLHCHGAQERDWPVLLEGGYAALHGGLRRITDELGIQLHYATARETANIIRAAEDGHCGNPGAFRDYYLLPPPRR
jgi:hypothetical protein